MDLSDLQYKNRKYQFMKAYAQSKLLMNISTFELAKRLNGTGITVNCVHPGAVKTSLGSDDAHHFAIKFVDRLIKFFFISPNKSAQTIIDLALSPEWEKITGKYIVKGKSVQSSLVTYDHVIAKRVLEITRKLIK